MFADKSIAQFMDDLASKSAVPGGGSAAALGGALAAALVSMVSHLTIGKRAYRDVGESMTALLAQSEALRQRILSLMEQDAVAYAQVMAAYRLPKDTDQEKQTQEQAWQSSLQQATVVPVELAQACSAALDLALPAAQMGNRWAVSDAGVAALLAEACLQGALLNAEINMQSITDQAFLAAIQQRIDDIVLNAAERKHQILELVHERMGA